MGTNTTHAGMEIIKLFADKALMETQGVQITFQTHGEAMSFRQQFYNMRSFLRKRSKKEYDYGHPEHGTSPYDGLVAKILADDTTIHIVTGHSIFDSIIITDPATGATLTKDDL